MKFRIKTGLFLFAFIILSVAIYIFSDNTSYASEVISPDEFVFFINSQERKPGAEIEMKSPELLVYITRPGGLPAGTQVSWLSSVTGVVATEEVKDIPDSNFINLVRKGPGYSTITANVKIGSQTYNLSFVVKIDLDFDYQRMRNNGSDIRVSNVTSERILVLNPDDPEQQVFLKYVDYVPEGGTTPVTGSAISAAAVSWESDNESVVTVTEEGKVKAVGSGSAFITVTTDTMSASDKTLTKSLRVVVAPTFRLKIDDSTIWYSSRDKNNFVPAENIPSNFVIESSAYFATNLKWEVYDVSANKKLPPSGDKLSYYVNENSGNVEFRNVKAGTYEIYAFANENFNVNTNAPYAYMKIIVPINLSSEDLVMNVGDTYNIVENSNIPNFNIFTVSYGPHSSQIVQVNENTGVITAKSKGKATVYLTYRPDANLYDPGSSYANDKTISITVIDSITLSASEAVLFTGGTLYLHAVVTDPTVPIVWSSSNPNIAKVENGLVTALRPGTAVITAQQTINGVIKKATCEITVQQSVTSISINPSVINIAIGEYKTLSATITPNISGVKLTWKTSNDKVVKIIETNPLTITVQGVSGGTAVITAINESNIVVGYCHVTVRQPVTRIQLSDTNVTVKLENRTLQLRAIVYPENAMNKEVRWTSSNTSIARVNNNGLVTFSSPGEVTIIATSVDNPEVMALCTITIEIPVSSVALDDKEITMYVGDTKRLTYSVLPVNASKTSVTWSSTNPSVASVDATGKVTARQAGTTVIMLKSLDGGHTAYCTVNVRQTAENIRFAKSEIEMLTGQVLEMEYSLVPANATDVSIIWESSDTRVVVVDEAGKVTAKGPGVAFVIARTNTGGMSYVKVTVKQAVSGLILNFTEKTIYVRDTFELKVSVTPSGATNTEVEWKSSNTNVATVSNKGEVTGISAGTAIIYCTTKDGGFTASCVVTVRELLKNMRLNTNEYRLSLNKTGQLTVLVDNKEITDQKFKWVSSNSDVVSVDKNGKITGHKLGTAIITAYAQDGSGADASCEVEVVRPVTKITLDKTYLNMYIGETKQLKAKVEPSNATYKTPYWFVEGDVDAIIIDEDGYITALKEGTVTIKVTAQDDSRKFAVCQVVVTKRVPATSVIISDKSLVMVQGEQRTIRPVLNPSNSTDGLTWSTDNSSVASVNSSGKITAKSTGTAYITVMTDSGKTATVEVNVIGLNVTELTLEQYSRYTLQVEGTTSRVIWDVADPEIAEVRNGVVITKARGTTTITANVNGRKLTCKLTVVKIK